MDKTPSLLSFAVAHYALRRGSIADRDLLVEFLSKTYQEAAGTQTFSHLAETVDRHFSERTPVWWVEMEATAQADSAQPIGCLWLGNAIDQQRGERHSYVLALYVSPAHRRRGIATALMQHAQDWARARGDHQVGLQVYAENPGAIALYQKLGYQTHSLWLTKQL
ncbi:MAG: GNAT family N-acetyltransferase [Leptolyngbyaceae cyanobacterium]